jgi:hypothetical protein
MLAGQPGSTRREDALVSRHQIDIYGHLVGNEGEGRASREFTDGIPGS